MAVKKHFTRDDFNRILPEYDLGDLTGFQPIIRGTVETNVMLKTSKGRFVFRYYEIRSKGSVLFESSLISHLKRRHYPCPAMLKDKHGKYVGIYKGKPFAIFEFAEGKHIEHPTDKQRNQLIAKVAELHKNTRGYRPTNIGQRMNYSAALCRRLARQNAQNLGTATAREKLAWIENELSELKLPRSLPKGVCHGDFHFSNVLYKNGRFSALLDFDDANYTYLLFDLWGLIDYAAWQHRDMTLDIRKARKVLREYKKHRPLYRIEERHLFDVYKLGVLFDSIWYFGRGTAEDFYEKRKIEYLNGMGREQFRRELFGCSK
jgi:Ser/Thr protein kinase RdoA (MazF antagonist)